MNAQPQHRLAYIDWARGMACLVMFQWHCYDSWLSDAARNTKFFWYSQFAGSAPAPIFLFLAGVSCAFVTDRMRQKGIAAREIARVTIRRGVQIFGLGLLFRLQSFLLAGAPWTGLLRVDVLNIIGLSLILLGAICWSASAMAAPTSDVPADGGDHGSPCLARARWLSVTLAALLAAAIVLATPFLWTTHRPRWLPWYLESYINGVHTFDSPRPWLFPIFPWVAFALLGLATGFLMTLPWSRRRELPMMALVGAGGASLMTLGFWLKTQPLRFYAVYDFWHTSTSFFLMRVAMVLLMMFLGYAWCRWGAGQAGLSPLIEMGRSSLLVYWVHIEFVYGGISILKKHAQTIGSATAGLVAISLAMIALAAVYNRNRGRGFRALVFWRNPARVEA